MKPQVAESRFDFRGGRNTAIAPDLLNANELVDATNTRLVGSYGALIKRSGTQRIHSVAFPGPINGVTQWDTVNGKQTVVISNGNLYWRNGSSFSPAFQQAVNAAAVARTTADQGVTAGWFDPDGVDDGINSLSGVALNTNATVAAANRLFNKLGDPAIDNNIIASDQLYTLSFKITADGTGLHEGFPPGDFNGAAVASILLEYSSDNGASWNPIAGLPYEVIAGVGDVVSTVYSPTITIASGAFAHLWIRLILTVAAAGSGAIAGTATGSVQVFNTVYHTDNYPITWTSGGVRFSTVQTAIFAPFRASSAGAPLVLYIASGGHLFSWDGATTLTQLDGTKNAPTATAIIAYHTRMFAMTANPITQGTSYPGENPKTIFWSKIGDATDFQTGDKTQGGSAVTDFLTGQHLVALEVIGSSLLLATIDSVMRFTGQSSDDIVIAQNTEGVSAEVGSVGLLALKRFENVAAMLAARGPYAVTETAATPIGEQVLPDFDGLDSANLVGSVVIYHRGRKELFFAVPGASDGGLNKTVFVHAVRLQAWAGPWLYSFGIMCMCNYTGDSGIENVLAGCSDGFVRLMDVGTLDDVMSDGSGGSAITMIVEEPPFHFGDPGITKALRQMKLQAKLPSGNNLQVLTSFDGDAEIAGSFVDTTFDGTLRDYRVDLDGQGKRMRLRFIDSSVTQPQINGFITQAYDMQRP